MAKTTAERMVEYRKRIGSDDNKRVVSIGISVTAVTKLKELAGLHRLSQKAMIERLLDEAYTPQPSTPQRASELLAQCSGDAKKAREVYRNELRMKYPGYSVKGPDTQKGQRLYGAECLYNAMCKQLEILSKTQS